MQTSDFEENLKYGRKKISEFVLAAQQSGYKIIGFIDKAIATGEALEKWFDRRTKQMESGHMNVFVKLPVIVGSIFSSLGVEVHYSTIDNDDTLAAFAHKVNIPNTMKTGLRTQGENSQQDNFNFHDCLSPPVGWRCVKQRSGLLPLPHRQLHRSTTLPGLLRLHPLPEQAHAQQAWRPQQIQDQV